jgi:hypothetical protein
VLWQVRNGVPGMDAFLSMKAAAVLDNWSAEDRISLLITIRFVQEA